MTEGKDQCKSGKKCEDLIEKTFPSLPRIMKRDNNLRLNNLNHELFISQFKHFLSMIHLMLLII